MNVSLTRGFFSYQRSIFWRLGTDAGLRPLLARLVLAVLVSFPDLQNSNVSRSKRANLFEKDQIPYLHQTKNKGEY